MNLACHNVLKAYHHITPVVSTTAVQALPFSISFRRRRLA